MKYIVVTGSSGGIGYETSLALLKMNYKVIGLDLLPSKINNKNYHHVICDVTSSSSIEEATLKIKDITSVIFMIYNIAGIFMLQTILDGKEEDLRKIIDINFFGVYKINRALFPLLTKGGKIVVFSSEVARYSPQPFNGYYALSKILVDKYADIFRRELNYLDVKVIKVQAGAIKTNLLSGVNNKYQDTVTNTKYYKKPLTKLKKLMDDEINKQVDPSKIGNKLAKLSLKKHPRLLYKMSNSFKLRFLNILPERLQDFIYVRVIK